MSDYRVKLTNFHNAMSRLKEGVQKWDEADDLARDGLIQRFEFTFELAWKTLKTCFEEEGLIGLNSPKTVLREAYAAGLLKSEELWLAMLQDRNSTAHIYSEQVAVQICRRIQERYLDAFAELIEQLGRRGERR